MKNIVAILLIIMISSGYAEDEQKNIRRIVEDTTTIGLFTSLINKQLGFAMNDSVMVLRYKDTVFTWPMGGTDTTYAKRNRIENGSAYVQVENDGSVTVSPVDALKKTRFADNSILTTVTADGVEGMYLTNGIGPNNGSSLWLDENRAAIRVNGSENAVDVTTSIVVARAGTSSLTVANNGDISITPNNGNIKVSDNSIISPVTNDGTQNLVVGNGDPYATTPTGINLSILGSSGSTESMYLGSTKNTEYFSLSTSPSGGEAVIKAGPWSGYIENNSSTQIQGPNGLSRIVCKDSSTGEDYIELLADTISLEEDGVLRTTVGTANISFLSTGDSSGSYTNNISTNYNIRPDGYIVNKGILDGKLSTETQFRSGYDGSLDPEYKYGIDLQWTQATRTLTVTHSSGTVKFWSYDKYFELTNGDPKLSAITPNENNDFYAYLDSTGQLQIVQDATITDEYIYYCAVAKFVYDSDVGNEILAIAEKHDAFEPLGIRERLHRTTGSVWSSGGNIVGGAAGATTIGIGSGTGYDEDVRIEFSPQPDVTGIIPKYYFDGKNASVQDRIKQGSANANVAIYDTDISLGVTGRVVYNLNTAGTWSPAILGASDYMCMHLFQANGAGLMVDPPITATFAIGQAAYNTISDARDGAEAEALSLTKGSTAAREAILMYTFIIDADGEIQAVDGTGATFIDWRVQSVGGGGGSTVQQDLASVLNTGNDAGGQDIVNVGSIGTTSYGANLNTSIIETFNSGRGSSFGGSNVSDVSYIMSNAIYDGTYKFKSNGYALNVPFSPLDGVRAFGIDRSTVSGTTGSDITWEQWLELNTNGVLVTEKSTTANIDAAGPKAVTTVEYCEDNYQEINTTLPLAGGTMSGDIAMGGNDITGLGDLRKNTTSWFAGTQLTDIGPSTSFIIDPAGKAVIADNFYYDVSTGSSKFVETGYACCSGFGKSSGVWAVGISNTSGTAGQDATFVSSLSLDAQGRVYAQDMDYLDIDTSINSRILTTKEYVDTVFKHNFKFCREGFDGTYSGGTATIPYTCFSEDGATLNAGDGVIATRAGSVYAVTFQFGAMAGDATAYYRIDGGTWTSIGSVLQANLNASFSTSIAVSANSEVEFGFSSASSGTFSRPTVTAFYRD